MNKGRLLLIFLLALISCKTPKNENNTTIVGNLDVSKDDKQIIFSAYSEQKGSSIYKMNFDGTNCSIIVNSDQNTSYFCPKYSKHNKILFIGYLKTDINNCSIYTANNDGSKIVKLTNGNENIIEAFFSNYEDKIYYCMASAFGKSSPVGQAQAHGMDIYSIDIYTKKEEKISNWNSYTINKISEADSTSFFVGISGDEEGGIFKFSKNSINKLTKIVPTNNPRDDASLYYEPQYSKQYDFLAFTAPYELYVMNLKDKIALPLVNFTSQKNVGGFAFCNTQEKIIFNFEDDLNLYSINLDGSDLKKIPILIE